MEFERKIEDMLHVVGKVEERPGGNGIQMSLPEEYVPEGVHPVLSKIFYCRDTDRKLLLKTALNEKGVVTIGEPTDLEIVTFARKAVQDMPNSPHTKGLYVRSSIVSKR